MSEMLKKILKKASPSVETPPFTRSFSQYGEDQIILALLFIFKLTDVNFMDIGANDPYVLNNTAILNEQGIFGINIEPDPHNFSKLQSARTKDINLNIGISDKPGVLKYYRFNDSVYNTFSDQEYQHLLKQSNLTPLPALDIAVNTYENVIKEYLNGCAPTLLFIDTEGLDEQIIDSIDFGKYAPKVLCIETFSYGEFRKDYAMIEKIKSRGYEVHADTFVNTIFIHQSLLPYPARQ
jgi:FkbM family methyltransferase